MIQKSVAPAHASQSAGNRFNNRSSWKSFACLVLMAIAAWTTVLSSSTALGQSDNSSVVGTVTDPTGAVISGASVTVTDEVNRADHKTSTNKSGFYTIAGLAPGKYTVVIVADGFSTVTRTNNNLDPGVPSTHQRRSGSWQHHRPGLRYRRRDGAAGR